MRWVFNTDEVKGTQVVYYISHFVELLTKVTSQTSLTIKFLVALPYHLAF